MSLGSRVRGLVRYVALGYLVILLFSNARAQKTQTQELPEVDTYVNLSERYRLMFMASRSTDGSSMLEVPRMDDNVIKGCPVLSAIGAR
jgi:hypothetical protein